MKKLLIVSSALLLALACGCSPASDNSSSRSSDRPSSQPISSSQSSNTLAPSNSSEPAPSISSDPPIVPTVTDFSNLSNKKQCWGQGYNVNEKNQPVSCPQYNQKYGKYDAIFMGTDESKIYLTFDEGYENGYTPKILDILKQKQVSAVFFITYDYAKGNPQLVRRMIDEGHIVGNHSWSHPSLPDKSTDKVCEEISKLHDYVEREFGYTMSLLRPPKGEFSERTLAITQSLGYKTVLWSFAYYDYDTANQPTEQKAIERVCGAKHGGAVYLLHAISQTNTNILGRVIDDMRAGGFTVAKFDI